MAETNPQKVFWSPSADGGLGGFYFADHPRIPDDARPVAWSRFCKLIDEGQANGARIVSNDKGNPVARYPDSSIDDRRRAASARVKREAARRIDQVAPLWKQVNAMREGADLDATWQAIDEIRAASNLIEQDLADSENPGAVDIANHPLWPPFEETN